MKIKTLRIQFHLAIIIAVISQFLLACNSNTVKDIDGNVYTTVKIGDQVWLAENLKVTRFRNGDPIPNVKDSTEWASKQEVAYSNYNNDENTAAAYGRLYNWYAVNDSRGLAPEGWHIPSPQEMAELVAYLKSDTLAGAKLKEKGTAHWLAPNKDVSNETGFSALPGGYRAKDGSFHTFGSNAYFWTNTLSIQMYSWSPRIFEGFADVDRVKEDMILGFSVRCVKDK